MTALMITGGILLFLLLLLASPIAVDIAYAGAGLSLRLRYLFFRFDFSPEALARRAEAQSAKKPGKRRAAKKAEEAEPGGEKAATFTLGAIWQMVKDSRRGLQIFRRHLIFSRVQIYAAVGGEDAHRTAIRFSQICALATAALDVIGSLFVLKKPAVGIAPDFTAPGVKYDLSLRVSIRPLFVLAAAANVLYRFLTSDARKRRRRPPPSPRRKRQAAKIA